MDSATTDKLLAGIKIPPAPFILQRIQEELRKDEPRLAEVADIIAQDVGMSGLVLRTVNSPFFGLRAKVRSIQHATSLLGIQYTANIVSGLLLKQTFEEGSGANPPNFWNSPTNVAMIAAQIARSFASGVSADEAYMLGLFHNSGQALMMQRFPDYNAFLTTAVNAPEALLTELESGRYNTDHATLSYLLARTWGLPEQITKVIRDHHNALEVLSAPGGAGGADPMLLCVLKMAEHVDKRFWGQIPDYEWEKIKDLVLDHVGMSEPDFEDLRDDLAEKLIEA